MELSHKTVIVQVISQQQQKIGETFGCCLFLVVSLVGNSLITIIIYKTKTMRTRANYFVLNMTVSGLLSFPVDS